MTDFICFQNQSYVPVGVDAGLSTSDGSSVLRVIKPEDNMEPDVPTYARLVGSNFHNGTIEVDVRARLSSWADIDCRGFIGIVFRASEADDLFEGFYVRPRNGRSCAEPQRRIHTMQYFSYPGYTFAYFRERGIADLRQRPASRWTSGCTSRPRLPVPRAASTWMTWRLRPSWCRRCLPVPRRAAEWVSMWKTGPTASSATCA